MSRAYHATQIAAINRHCSKVLEFQRANVPYPREQFQTGTSAHAIIEAVGNATNKAARAISDLEVRDIAQSVSIELISHGRSFDKNPEPPLAPDRVFAGRDLACDWLHFSPLEPGSSYEIGLAIDATGRPVDYWSEDAKVRAILDKVTVATEEDEESSRLVCVVTDFKSAWSADADELESTQRKVQAVVAWKTFGAPAGADMLRLEVANLRLQKTFTLELWAQDGLNETIASWTRDVLSTCAALDEMERVGRGKMPAAPGAGCNGCPYLQACPDALDYIERRGLHKTPEKKAMTYAVAKAMVEELAEELRAETDEAPIEINGGIVGTIAKEQDELTDDAHEIIAEAWEESGGELVGFAKALELSKRNVERMARVLFPDRKERADRDELVESVTQKTKKRAFGVWPKVQPKGEEAK